MNAQDIELALASRYKGPGWATFFEFRPMTSFEATLGSIDLLAVGLWRRHDKIVAHEIKVTRSDFLTDLKKFRKKHKVALEISHEFYYVCPWSLIPKDEIPEITGLMYVDKNQTVKIIKPAPLRELDQIPFLYFQGFAREFGNKVDHSKIPIKYLGKEMTQEDILKLVDEKKDWQYEEDVKKAAKALFIEARDKKAAGDKFIQDLKDASGYFMNDEKAYAEIVRYCRVGRIITNDHEFKYNFGELKNAMQRVEDEINRTKKEENHDKDKTS